MSSPSAPIAGMVRAMFRGAWFLLAFVVSALPAWTAAAHPHIWIDADVTVRFEAKKAAALEVTWLFDDFYSATQIDDFTKGHRGKPTAADFAAMVDQSNRALKDFSFLTRLWVAGKERRVTEVRSFTAGLSAHRLVYRFTVPIEPAIDVRHEPFGFLLYDETHYVDLILAKGHKVAFAGEAPGSCREEPLTGAVAVKYRPVDEIPSTLTFHPTLYRILCE